MDTTTKIEKLEIAVAEIATELAFALRHIERLAQDTGSEEVRHSDRHMIAQVAERLEQVAESLRP